MNRYILAFAVGLAIAGLTAGLLLTHALGAGWVFLIDVGSTAAFAVARGWQMFGGGTGTGARTPVPVPTPEVI